MVFLIWGIWAGQNLKKKWGDFVSVISYEYSFQKAGGGGVMPAIRRALTGNVIYPPFRS